jgi:hypothetical protein
MAGEFTATNGGTIQPGGPSKGVKTKEYWKMVERDANKQIKENKQNSRTITTRTSRSG